MTGATTTRPGTAARLAAVLGIGSALALLGLAVVGTLWGPVPDPAGRVLEWWTVAWVGFPLTGALIATRRTTSRIGWSLIGIGVAMAASRIAGIYLTRAFGTLPGELPTGDVLVGSLLLLGALGDEAAFLLVGVTLVHFPGDRITRRWRRILPLGIAATVLSAVGATLRPQIALEDGSFLPNPLSAGWSASLGELLSGAGLLVAIIVALAIADLVVRYRRSEDAVRQQLKWLAYPAGLFLAGAIPTLLVVHDEVAVLGAVVWTGLFVVCFNGIAVAIGVAVLRHRLYEIDRIVSRTVSYAVVSGALVATYAGGVLVLGRVLAPVTRQSEVAVAASTLLAAALFQPLRRRVQSVVDRRFNRSRYDSQRTVADFATAVRDGVDLGDLQMCLARAVGATVQPERMQVWLAPQGGSGSRGT